MTDASFSSRAMGSALPMPSGHTGGRVTPFLWAHGAAAPGTHTLPTKPRVWECVYGHIMASESSEQVSGGVGERSCWHGKQRPAGTAEPRSHPRGRACAAPAAAGPRPRRGLAARPSPAAAAAAAPCADSGSCSAAGAPALPPPYKARRGGSDRGCRPPRRGGGGGGAVSARRRPQAPSPRSFSTPAPFPRCRGLLARPGRRVRRAKMARSGSRWPRLLLPALLALALPAAAERRPGPAGERGAGAGMRSGGQIGMRCGGWDGMGCGARAGMQGGGWDAVRGLGCGGRARRRCVRAAGMRCWPCGIGRFVPGGSATSAGRERWDPPLGRVIFIYLFIYFPPARPCPAR